MIKYTLEHPVFKRLLNSINEATAHYRSYLITLASPPNSGFGMLDVAGGAHAFRRRLLKQHGLTGLYVAH